MQIIDGKLVASQVLEEVKGDIDRLKAAGITPGLAVVLVGDDPAPETQTSIPLFPTSVFARKPTGGPGRLIPGNNSEASCSKSRSQLQSFVQSPRSARCF